MLTSTQYAAHRRMLLAFDDALSSRARAAGLYLKGGLDFCRYGRYPKEVETLAGGYRRLEDVFRRRRVFFSTTDDLRRAPIWLQCRQFDKRGEMQAATEHRMTVDDAVEHVVAFLSAAPMDVRYDPHTGAVTRTSEPDR